MRYTSPEIPGTDEHRFPFDGSSEEKLVYLVGYAVQAPSSHNSQPWVFEVKGDTIELYADDARRLPVCDPDGRELVISCGAALFSLRVAMRQFGMDSEVELYPETARPDLLARVRIAGSHIPTEEERLLFDAIPKRRTNRHPFEEWQPPDSLLTELRDVAEEEGAWLRFLTDRAERVNVAELVAQGDRMQMADPAFRIELAEWLRPNRGLSHDGMPGYAMGYSDLMSAAAPLLIRTFDIGSGNAAKDHELAEGSPVLAVLGTDGDSPSDWLRTGQALDRVLLQSYVEGVWASFLNQPIEVAELRPKVAELCGREGFPQLLLRLGYGPEVRPTPRRPVAEVLRRTGADLPATQ